MSAPADEVHGGPVHPILIGKLFSPGEGSDVAVFVHGVVSREAELFAQGGVEVGSRAVIQEQASEGIVASLAGAPRLGDDASEEWGVTAEPVGVNGCGGVRVGSSLEHPAGYVVFIVIDAEMEQGAAGEGCPVQGVGGVKVAAELKGKDFAMGEGTAEEAWVALEMGGEEIEPAAVDGHGRCVGEGQAGGVDEFEAAMFAGWIAGVGLEDEGNGGKGVALSVGEG